MKIISTYKLLAYLLILSVFPLIGKTQTPAHFAFSDHEKISYKVYYNWGFIWLEAARAYFKTDIKNLNNNKYLYLEGSGKTLPGYDWFFKVRGSYSSYVDMQYLQPFRHFRDTHEGGFELHNNYIFDYDNSKIYAYLENSDKPKQLDTLNLKPGVMDILTATYFVRNIDYSNMSVNDTVPVSILLDGQYYNIYIRYRGKETIDDRQQRHWKCLKFSALLVAGTIFEGGEDMLVWVSDDENKIPVLVEAKILVGSVKAYLNTWEGVRYPIKFR
ncbi:MAG: DUF3108 domain-containing protein [Bacteroidota bacterium]|nr:DUF3108 domain-containing protein [Bacteroidota bacterium]